MSKRYALVCIDDLEKQIADTITSQLATRKCTITALEPQCYATPEHEIGVIARNVAAPMVLAEIDLDVAAATFHDVLDNVQARGEVTTARIRAALELLFQGE